jgi:polysaccharide pyruvyl transferase WcaK-like protein
MSGWTKDISKLRLKSDSLLAAVDFGHFTNSRTRRSEAAMVRKIGLLNHMGFGNLGDDATQDAVMRNIKSRWPNAEISLFSMNPADTRSRHGVPSYPIRLEFLKRSEEHANGSGAADGKLKNRLRKHRLLFQLLRTIKTVTVEVPRRFFDELFFLGRSFRTVRSFDLFIVSGGGQLLDSWGGAWKFPYTVFKWTLLARLSRTKCYFLDVGAGPLAHPLAKWFVRSALGLADYVSFRDADSRTLIEKIGFKGKSQVAADCVYVLDPSAPPVQSAGREAPIVGLSPMAYCDPRTYWQKDQAVYERFIHNVASFGSWLGRNDYRLTLFSTEIWFDSQTIEEVKALIVDASGDLRSHLVNHEDIVGIDELLATMYSTDYIITCRFHGVVFAHLLNKPVIALSHHPKVSSLMNDLGLARYCLDIRKCDANMLQETFLSLVANEDEIRGRMADKLACFKRSLSIQFDQLFPPGDPSGLRPELRK